LPLVAGISVVDTLAELTGLRFDLKWPNDVLYRGKKIAGILIENTITDDTLFCVAGMGINLNHSLADFPQDLVHIATSLKMAAGLPQDIQPGEVVPMLATSFSQWLEKVNDVGEEEVIITANRYSRHLLDTAISFHQPPGNKKINGLFKGINHDGGLILEREDGSTAIYHSGEVCTLMPSSS
jgi:BirA family transcriptional regulator, biotin operon repressor / biotin---[acetyl-CoA-carboxylase] ligase